MDKHIKQVRQRFGFNVKKTGKRGKQTPPSTFPAIMFTEKGAGMVPSTTGTPVSTTSSATPTTSSIGGTSSMIGLSAGTIGQAIGSVTIAGSGSFGREESICQLSHQ